MTDNFPPEVNAPASRTFEHCREWVRAGHQVTVITGTPNFPKGQVFPGYCNCLYTTEAMAGIRVVRVRTYITGNTGFVRRILDYLSFMGSAILAGPFERDVDLVVGTSPQLFTPCAAYLISRLKRVPYIFELRDLWPESIKAVGAVTRPRIIAWLERLEMFLYRKAARIVCVTESFKATLVARGIEQNKIDVLTNGVDLKRFRPIPRDAALSARLGLDGKFVVGYIGTHGMAHALETLLEAAAELQRRPEGKNVLFLFLGDGARKEKLTKRAAEMDLNNVWFMDTVPKEEVPRCWSLLDVSVIHLRKTPLFKTVIPSKLFESMGMGIPVLHGVEGESAAIVERQEAGLLFEPENSGALVEGILRLKSDPSLYRRLHTRAVGAASHYDRRILAERMLAILEQTQSEAA